MLVTINEQNFDSEIVKYGQPVLVDFWAPWCGPCLSMAPVIEQIAKEFEGRVKVGKMNVDENKELTARFGIRGIPTLLFFKDGKVVAQEVGFTTKEGLVEKINSVFGS